MMNLRNLGDARLELSSSLFRAVSAFESVQHQSLLLESLNLALASQNWIEQHLRQQKP